MQDNGRDITIEGRNPVYEALASGTPIDKILVSETARRESLYKLLRLAKEKGVPVQTVHPSKLDAVAQTQSNQGVVALGMQSHYVSVDDLLARAAQKNEPPFLVIADEITDPHNLGAILRTANACGVHGVVIQKNRSAGLNATVAKTSAGAVSYTPVARVTNIASCLDQLKAAGLWIAGADMRGQQDLFHADLSGALGLVIGSEGKGIGRLVREKCDFLVRIPMLGEINSLNASVAAAVMMYEAVRCRIKN